MKIFNSCIILIVGVASTVFAHDTVKVHSPLAEKAWEKVGFTPDIRDVRKAKMELINGAKDEDNETDMWGDDDKWHQVTRSSLHGYNPLTATTGGVFNYRRPDFGDPKIDWPSEVPHRTAKQRVRDLWQDGVRDRAAYSNMQTAFVNNDLYGGDGHGGYHYLGRVSHMLQDMTSSPHILWQNVFGSHCNYEDFWAKKWQDWWTNFGSSATREALKPTNGLPSRAILWLDPYSKERITYHWNQVKADTPNDFMDTMAWIAYFRVSIWGEIKDDEIEAAPATTTPTNGVGTQSNSLRTMFGPGNIRYTWFSLIGYQYWTIYDRLGYPHYFEVEALIDDWWPAEGDFPDGHYESGDKSQYTGRFYFSRPGEVTTGLGYGWGTWPRYYPDGSAATKSLAEYYGDCLFPLTIQYNAGLLSLAHPRVTIQTSPSDQGLGICVDGTTYTNSHTFRWPINSPHTIGAPASQTGSDGRGYKFQYWSNGESRTHTINPDSDANITAIYSTL
jgi:hypothetical protein